MMAAPHHPFPHPERVGSFEDFQAAVNTVCTVAAAPRPGHLVFIDVAQELKSDLNKEFPNIDGAGQFRWNRLSETTRNEIIDILQSLAASLKNMSRRAVDPDLRFNNFAKHAKKEIARAPRSLKLSRIILRQHLNYWIPRTTKQGLASSLYHQDDMLEEFGTLHEDLLKLNACRDRMSRSQVETVNERFARLDRLDRVGITMTLKAVTEVKTTMQEILASLTPAVLPIPTTALSLGHRTARIYGIERR